MKEAGKQNLDKLKVVKEDANERGRKLESYLKQFMSQKRNTQRKNVK